MALNFPNPNRSYDAKHHCVRFWGYDGAFEISFVVEQRVFSRINPGAIEDESEFSKFSTGIARRFFRRPPSLSWPPPRGVHIGSGRFLSWPRVRTCGRTCLLLISTTGAKGVSLMATAHYLDGRGVESDDAAVHVNPSQAMMTDTSKAISDDFSNCSDNSPLSPPKIPADI